MTKTKYHAILSDYDGTLAGMDGTVSPRTRKAIQNWIAQGGLFSIATGRQYIHIQDECRKIGLTSPQIVRGGAEIADGQTGNILDEASIPSEVIDELMSIFVRHNIPFTAESGSTIYTTDGKPFAEIPGVEAKHYSEIGANPIPKIVLWTDAQDEKNIQHIVEEEIEKGHPSLEVVKSYTPFIKTWQVTSAEGTKYTATKKLAAIWGIQPEEMIGIGDNFNDIPLLDACGYKVAMENAPPEVKERADEVIPPFDTDGVAVFVEGLLTV